MINCIKCDTELVKLPFFSDREQLRPDYFCGECNTRFGTTKSKLFIISEPCDTSKLAKENMELKITIKNMLKIREDF